ncbi:transmembrane protein, putative [Medicago truncatula]|uniref:Transmembrane protein, putative n=1 Tax=Medicago truncatula TaxID=3880 RepID=A0A072U3V3_MEDTR|nr:transmembrane protein, putative [Medicago truncatula]
MVASNLVLFTIWATKRGQDFSFLGPFLFRAFSVFLLFGPIQILFPLLLFPLAPIASAASTHCASSNVAAEATAMSVLGIVSPLFGVDEATVVAAMVVIALPLSTIFPPLN